VGGSSSQSMYSNFLPKYNQRKAIDASFVTIVEGSSSGLIDFDINVTAIKVANYTGPNPILQVVVTESHIQDSWGMMTEVNFCERMMIPSHNGTELDFSASDTVELNFSFTLDQDWVAENCELVVFLQNNTSREVLQGGKNDMMEFGNVNDYDVSVTEVSNLPENACIGELEPWVTIRNNGNLNLTTLDIQYNVNGGANSTYNWTGDLEFLESEMVYLPAIAYTPEDENLLTLYSENPNGNADQYPLNDTAKVTLEKFVSPQEVNLFIRTDANPEENTWELADSEGTVLYSGGPYSTPSATITESFDLDPNECYRFTMYDAGGDGFIVPGFFFLYYGNNNAILQGFGFGDKLYSEFFTDDPIAIPEKNADVSMLIYPNPSNNMANIIFTLDNPDEVSMRVYNMLGEEVLREDSQMMSSGEQLIQVNTSTLKNGMYFLQLQVGSKHIIEKLTVSR